MSEMAFTADHLVIIGRGRLLADTSMDAFTKSNGAATSWCSRPKPSS